MKLVWFIFLLVLCTSIALAIPASDVQLTTFVQDYAGILTPEQTTQISAYGQQLYDQKLAQYSVVIVDSLEGQDAQSYALEVAQGNLGDTTNNGLLLLISIEDRAYRFEVGRGLEPIFNDAKVGRYGRDYLVPNFQQEEYAQGILLVSQAIAAELDSESFDAPASPETEGKYTFVGIIIVFIFIYLIFLFSVKKKGKKLEPEDFFMAGLLAASMFGGGRGGSGGRSGGFGGGGFGGGGAGGRW